eukprot:315781-Chlamydomonas_euryale.AAC.2
MGSAFLSLADAATQRPRADTQCGRRCVGAGARDADAGNDPGSAVRQPAAVEPTPRPYAAALAPQHAERCVCGATEGEARYADDADACTVRAWLMVDRRSRIPGRIARGASKSLPNAPTGRVVRADDKLAKPFAFGTQRFSVHWREQGRPKWGKGRGLAISVGRGAAESAALRNVPRPCAVHSRPLITVYPRVSRPIRRKDGRGGAALPRSDRS